MEMGIPLSNQGDPSKHFWGLANLVEEGSPFYLGNMGLSFFFLRVPVLGWFQRETKRTTTILGGALKTGTLKL